MLKKLLSKFLIPAILVMVISSGLHAQTGTRIKFKRGTSSASVSGTLRPGASRTYVMHVRAEQEINAVVSGKNVLLDNGMLTMQYNAPNGDNFIKVINHGKTSAKYTMTVSIQ